MIDVAALADAHPTVQIVLNHVGGSLVIGRYEGKREEVLSVWRLAIFDLAKRPDVYVKLGGLGMPLYSFHHRDPKPESAELAEAWRPYIETCIDAFGPSRGMFESNFPVDRASCGSATVWNTLQTTRGRRFGEREGPAFQGDRPRRCYWLD
ncbi:putative TIM-barrel fold metal-dependent hydrolase [Bradyrhizobium sp. i1.7.7]